MSVCVPFDKSEKGEASMSDYERLENDATELYTEVCRLRTQQGEFVAAAEQVLTSLDAGQFPWPSEIADLRAVVAKALTLPPVVPMMARVKGGA